MSIFTDFFKSNELIEKTASDYVPDALRELIAREVAATQGMFGELSGDVKRDFFCLDDDTWIWYEEWADEKGRKHHMTTRYRIESSRLVKSVNGESASAVSPQEARSLKAAMRAYVKLVTASVYADESAPS